MPKLGANSDLRAADAASSSGRARAPTPLLCDKTLFIMRAIGAQKSARRPHSYTGHTLAGGLELPLPPLPAVTPNGRQPLGK